MTTTIAQYPLDAVLLNGMSADERSDFIKYMAELDAENERRSKPYGHGSLWKTTGAGCWYDHFEDGQTAAEAMDEDLSDGN